MKKKEEQNHLEEPAIIYNSTKKIPQTYLNAPCQYSPQELKERAILAILQMENGEGITHEEMKKKFH